MFHFLFFFLFCTFPLSFPLPGITKFTLNQGTPGGVGIMCFTSQGNLAHQLRLDLTRHCTRWWHNKYQLSLPVPGIAKFILYQVAPGGAGIMCSTSQGKVSSCTLGEAQVRQVPLCLRHNLFSGDDCTRATICLCLCLCLCRCLCLCLCICIGHNLFSGDDCTGATICSPASTLTLPVRL